MTNRERFQALLNGEPADRTPVIEWASWWKLTVNRWFEEGLPQEIKNVPHGLQRYFGQDHHWQFWIGGRNPDAPVAEHFGAPLIREAKDYDVFRKRYLYGDSILKRLEAELEQYLQNDPSEEYVTWFTLEGFFWFPRTLFGIEEHLYAFYDEEEWMLRINRELCDFYKKVIDLIYRKIKPQFMTFAEDMSYNNGPMISHELYKKFMHPFYLELIPVIQSHGTKVFIDTDGAVEPLIPWFMESGIEGVLPLERQAGVDVNRIRQNYPTFLMLGGYDKTVMKHGEDAMRAEFERIKPAICQGRYIPSVDHQTPPDVSLENYKVYMRLLREYAREYGKDL